MDICWYCTQACRIPFRESCDRFVKKKIEFSDKRSGKCSECGEPTTSSCGDRWLCGKCYVELQAIEL